MNWMKYKWLYFGISALVLIPGIVSLVRFGLRPAIDFTGGTVLELQFKQDVASTTEDDLKKVIQDQGFTVSSIQSSGQNTYLLRLGPITRDELTTINSALVEKFGSLPDEVRFETVGPVLGQELLAKTIVAIVLAAGFILFYIAWRFKNAKFGICAILAMFHDSLVLLGVFSLLGFFFKVEVDTLFVTAMLTILSFSVHDTVVVYDRIRESRKFLSNLPFEETVDKAVTETLSRSLNNSLTIVFMLVALWLLGGETTKWFVFALLIGTISGTYSSTFTAAPLLVVWNKFTEKNREGGDKNA